MQVTAIQQGEFTKGNIDVPKPGSGQEPIGTSPAVPGAYSEYMLLSEEFLLAVPDQTPTEAAALVEPLPVAIHAVAKASLTGEDTALIMGCGPIGLAGIAGAFESLQDPENHAKILIDPWRSGHDIEAVSF